MLLRDTRTGKATSHELKPVAGRPGQYAGRLKAEAVGTYVLTVDEAIARASNVAAKQIVVELPQEEMRRTEANPRTLAALASGKQTFLRIDEAGDLAERIGADTLTTVEEQRFGLWDTAAMWVLLAVLLTAEWFTRKRINLM